MSFTMRVMACLIWAAAVWAQDAPWIKIDLATTRLLKPVKPEGGIDYLAALQAAGEAAVGGRSNAAAQIVEICGPEFYDESIRPAAAAAFKAQWPEKGPFFVVHPIDLTGSDDEDYYRGLDQAIDSAIAGGWDPKESLELGSWLRRNTPVLERIAQAGRQSHWALPLVSGDPAQPLRMTGRRSLGRTECLRNLGRILLLRAAQRQSSFDAIWPDVESAHRLGMLMTEGQSLHELRQGVFILQAVNAMMHEWGRRNAMDDAHYRQFCRWMADLPSPRIKPAMIDGYERLAALDLAQRWSRDDQVMNEELSRQAADQGPLSDETIQAAIKRRLADGQLRRADWNVAMRRINGYYDTVMAAMKLPRPADRGRAAGQLAMIRRQIAAEIARSIEGPASPDQLGGWIAAVILAGGPVELEEAPVLADIAATGQDLAVTMLAMGAQLTRKQGMPASLSMLRGPHFKAPPPDRFSGKPLIYRQTPDGWALYSVGPNLKDDKGHHRSAGAEWIEADDVVVRVGQKD